VTSAIVAALTAVVRQPASENLKNMTLLKKYLAKKGLLNSGAIIQGEAVRH
jgi:hypothetical protein